MRGTQMSRSDDENQLWTAWCDYSATGEGRSIMGCIGYARSEQEIKARFAEKFGDWFAKGSEAQEGVVRNEVTQFLWTEAMLTTVESCGRHRGWVDTHCWMHFNFS